MKRREQASRGTGTRAWLPDGSHRPLQKQLVGLEAIRFVRRLTARESFHQRFGTARKISVEVATTVEHSPEGMGSGLRKHTVYPW